MATHGETWCVVLAAGDGTRLAGVTAALGGSPVPKQYCSLVESRSLLRATLDRMSRLVPRERVLVVVAEAHRRHWERELADWPARNLIAQPENRGTAAGLLLPLLELARRDAEAKVVVSPADHHFADESTFLATVRDALASLERPAESLADPVILLGVAPDRVESGYGWIVPTDRALGSSLGVGRFVEKPDFAEASALRALGAVWNSFVVVSRLAPLLDLYVAREPALFAGMSGALARSSATGTAEALRTLYARLEPRDFSRHLLAGAEERLALMPIPPCGWTDLGTPERLAAVRAARTPPVRARPVSERRRASLPFAQPALA